MLSHGVSFCFQQAIIQNLCKDGYIKILSKSRCIEYKWRNEPVRFFLTTSKDFAKSERIQILTDSGNIEAHIQAVILSHVYVASGRKRQC